MEANLLQGALVAVGAPVVLDGGEAEAHGPHHVRGNELAEIVRVTDVWQVSLNEQAVAAILEPKRLGARGRQHHPVVVVDVHADVVAGLQCPREGSRRDPLGEGQRQAGGVVARGVAREGADLALGRVRGAELQLLSVQRPDLNVTHGVSFRSHAGAHWCCVVP